MQHYLKNETINNLLKLLIIYKIMVWPLQNEIAGAYRHNFYYTIICYNYNILFLYIRLARLLPYVLSNVNAKTQ